MKTTVAIMSALTLAVAGGGIAYADSLNPQPEPPGKAKVRKLKPGEAHMLNPQPEPPGKVKQGKVKPGEAQGFNPQPDPPGKAKGLSGKVTPQ